MIATVSNVRGVGPLKRTRSWGGATQAACGRFAGAAVVWTAPLLAFLAACFLAPSRGDAQGRWVLREVSTSIDTTDKDAKREVPWNKHNRLVERRADGVLVTESGEKPWIGTFEIDPGRCKAQSRAFDREGRFAAASEFEWTKPPDVWEVGKLYEFTAKVRVSGDHSSTAGSECADFCYYVYPAEMIVAEKPASGPNPWRSQSPGNVRVAWREGPTKESAGTVSARCKVGSSVWNTMLITVSLQPNLQYGQFDIYYRYDWKPDENAGADQRKPPEIGTTATGRTPPQTTKTGDTKIAPVGPPLTETGGGPRDKDGKTPPGGGGGPLLVADRVSAFSGETVWVPVSLIDVANLANMNFDVSYDPEGAQLVEIYKGEFLRDRLFEANSGETGRVRAGFAGKTALSGTGRAMALRFRVTGAAGATVPIRVSVRESNDLAGVRVAVGTRDGAIEIRGTGGPGSGGPGGGGPGGAGPGGGGPGGRGPGGGGPGGGGPGGGGPGGWEPTALDASRALKMSVRLLQVEMRYDVSVDGAVTARDATMILQQNTARREARASR